MLIFAYKLTIPKTYAELQAGSIHKSDYTLYGEKLDKSYCRSTTNWKEFLNASAN